MRRNSRTHLLHQALRSLPRLLPPLPPAGVGGCLGGQAPPVKHQHGRDARALQRGDQLEAEGDVGRIPAARLPWTCACCQLCRRRNGPPAAAAAAAQWAIGITPRSSHVPCVILTCPMSAFLAPWTVNYVKCSELPLAATVQLRQQHPPLLPTSPLTGGASRWRRCRHDGPPAALRVPAPGTA